MNTLHKVAVGISLGLVLPLFAFAAGPAPVSLGTAGNFVILAKTGVSKTGVTSVIGNIGLSPAAATYLTGFALTLPVAGAFSTSAIVNGNVYASDYANPTPATLTTAVLDMQAAYTDAMGRAPSVTELGAGNIGGFTLIPGVYKWGTSVNVPTDVTLSGGANDVWIFQIAQNLNVSPAALVILSGGAQASNVFWVVAGQTTIGTNAAMSGNILDKTAIVFNTGATLNGRALAQTAVTLDANAVTMPQSSGAPVVVTPVATTTPVSTTTPAILPAPSVLATTTPAITLVPPVLSATSSQPIGTHTVTILPVSSPEQTALHIAQSQLKAVATDLGEGSKGDEVKMLQQFLIALKYAGPAASGLAEAGTTGYFGQLTRAALAQFQAMVGIDPALGIFGPLTRAYVGAN